MLGVFAVWWGPSILAAPPVVPESIKTRVRQRVDYGYSAGVVVGMINVEGRATFAYGNRILGLETPVDERTLFEIGSVTKVFTALLLADSVARGELDFKRDAQSLMPEGWHLPLGSPEISLLHLATQSSGLPNNPDNLCVAEPTRAFECYTEDAFREFLGRYVLPREPGSAWEYSNTGFGLLGLALAKHYGKSYEALLRERILDPLGLRDTMTAVPDALSDRKASGYSGVLSRPDFQIPVLEGAGVLRSTVEDLLTFVSFHLGFQESALKSAMAEAVKVRTSTAYPAVQQGLGWWLWNFPAGRVVQHGGDTFGQTACVAFHPARRFGVVVLSNARANAYASILDLALNLMDSSYPLTTLRKPFAVSEMVLRDFEGSYRSPEGDRFRFTVQLGHLIAHHEASRSAFTLYPQTAIKFAGLDIELGGETYAAFQRDAAGRGTAMDWTQRGQTSRYDREQDPNRIVVELTGSEVLLGVSGEDAAAYDVEISPDLLNWKQVGSTQTGSEAVRVPRTAADGARFFRAVRRGP